MFKRCFVFFIIAIILSLSITCKVDKLGNTLSNIKLYKYVPVELDGIDILDKTLNDDLLNRDRKALEEIIPVFFEMKDIDTYANKYNFNRQSIDYRKQLGLDYSIITLKHPGGWYTARSLKILADKDSNIIISKIRFNGSPDAMEVLINEYNLLDKNIEIIEINGEKVDINLDIEYYNNNLYDKFINDFSNYFNYNTEIIIPNDIFEEYQLLTDPFNNIRYGYTMGYSGNTTSARIAFRKILELNNKDILFSILTSPNPEGRIFAIEGLRRQKVNVNEYKTIIKKIIRMNLIIDNSEGCFGSSVLINSNRRLNEVILVY